MKWILHYIIVICIIDELYGEYTPINVKPHLPFEFSLQNAATPSLNEYYKIFAFSNTVSETKKSDMIIQLTSKPNDSTKLAIYDSLDAIKQNAQNIFIDFKWEVSTLTTETIIKQDDPLYQGTGVYYLAFYDFLSKFTSFLIVFNEADVKDLVSLNCYSIPHLYSLNSLIFRIPNQGSQYMHYTMTTGNHSKNPLVLIKEGHHSTGRLIRYYNMPSASDYILLHTDIKEYHITISSEFTPYEDFNKIICIELLTNRIKLIPNQSPFERDFIFSMKYYFTVELKEYDIKEDNEVILSVNDDTVYEAVDELLCSYTSSKKDNDEANENNSEIAYFPFNEEENECPVIKDDKVKNMYHLYFRRADESLDLLLITLQLRKNIIGKFSFNFRQLPHSTFLQNEGDMKIDITTPLYYRINLDTLQRNMILFSSVKHCQSALYGSLSSKKKLNEAKYHNQMIAFNKHNKITTNNDNGNKQESIVYIKFYDPNSKEQNHLMIKYIDEDVYYLGNDIKQSITLPIQNINCNKPVYFISITNQKSIGLLSLEVLYGKHETYHLHSYKSQTSIIDMLPNKNNAEVLSEPLRLESDIDMMQINCISPLSLNVNINSETKPKKQVKRGDSFRIFLGNKEELIFDLLIEGMMGIDISIESKTSRVNVFLNNKKVTQLDNMNMNYRDLIIVTNAEEKEGSITEYPILFSSISEEGSFIYAAFGKEDLFKIIKETSQVTNQQNILIQLSKSDKYKNVLVNIATSETELSFCYAEGMTVLPEYVPLPNTNCLSLDKTYSFLLENPYDKYNEDSSVGINFYYISLSFNKIPTQPISFTITYTQKEQVEIIKEGNQIFLDNKTGKYHLGYSSDDEEDLLLFNINVCMNEKVEYVIDISGITYSKEKVQKKNAITVMKNYLVTPDVTFTQSKGLFSYRYVTEADYKNFKPTQDYSIQQSNTENIYTLRFKPYVKDLAQYDIYLIKTEEDATLPDGCGIHSEKPKISFENDGADENINFLLELQEMTPGYYALTIIATELSGLKTSAIYDSIRIEFFGKGIPYWVWIVVSVLLAFLIIGGIIIGIRYYKHRKSQAIEDKTKLLTSIIDETNPIRSNQ